MTQGQLKILSLLFLSAACFSLFNLPTLIFLAISFFFIYKYVNAVYARFISIGLIQMLPQTLQQNLLNRSIFDIVCDFWFYDSFVFLKRLLKLLCKPLIEPIEPDNAIEALHDMQPQMKKIYLVKGVVRVLPQILQNLILGRKNAERQRLRLVQDQDQSVKKIEKINHSDKNTFDISEEHQPRRLKRTTSQSQIYHPKLEEESASNERQLRKEKAVGVRESMSIDQRRPKRLNMIQNVQHSLKMLKRLLQMQNITQHIHRTSTTSILKVMFVFCLALYVQVKHRNSRQIVIKILYVLGGIITVLGTVGTTGVLIIKHCKARKNSGNTSQIQL